MMTLYEINQQLYDLLNNVDPDTGELLATDDDLNALTLERTIKIDDTACFIKNLKAEADAIWTEETKLAKRRKSIEDRAEWLSDYLKNMLAGEKFKSPRNSISYRKSTSVEVDDKFVDWADVNDDSLLRYKAPEPNRKAIGEYLKSGGECPYARLVEKTSMIVR